MTCDDKAGTLRKTSFYCSGQLTLESSRQAEIAQQTSYNFTSLSNEFRLVNKIIVRLVFENMRKIMQLSWKLSQEVLGKSS